METYFTDNGYYAAGALVSDFGFNATATVDNETGFGTETSPGAQSWCMVASHQSHDELWYLGSGGTLSQDSAAGCPSATFTGTVPTLP
jgi:hypothetical protein